MARQIARTGDIISHGGAVQTGSPNTLCNGRPIARVGDAVMCAIHGAQIVASGSPNTLVNGRPMARYGDLISCGARINSGSPNSFCN